MKLESDILKLLSKKYPKKKVMGVRFLSKTGENEWKFRFTFKDGNYLSMSDELMVKYDGLKLVEKTDTSIFVSPGVFTIEHDNSVKKTKVKSKTK
jgi:hypothetical protein